MNLFKKGWMMLMLLGAGSIAFAARTEPAAERKLTADERTREAVVDRLVSRMSLREQIGQLYILAFSTRQSPADLERIERQIRRWKPGGLILMYSDVQPAADLINRWTDLPEIPFLMTIDAEWGLAMRFDPVVMFPQQMQLGSLRSPELVYEMGLAVGRQLRRFGMQVNYAPDVDINNNALNPVINVRSFGEDPERVLEYARAYARGMRDAGIAVCLKHFPGHGDTSVDSHHDLPVLPFDRARLDSLELLPFREMIRAGETDLVMLGHLNVPALDPTGTPTSISRPVVTDLLKEELGFRGLVVTDALGMKGVANHLSQREIPLAAFQAGVDLMLMPKDVPGSVRRLMQAVRRGEIDRREVEERCRKVLRLKYDLGLLPLDQPRLKIRKEALMAEINAPEFRDLNRRIAEQSLIRLPRPADTAGQPDVLPLRGRTAYLGFGDEGLRNGAILGDVLREYGVTDCFVLDRDATEEEFNTLKDSLDAAYETVVVGIHHTHRSPDRRFGLNEWQAGAVDRWAAETVRPRLVLAFFGIPYGVTLFRERDRLDAVIIAHLNTDYNNRAVAELLFGRIEAQGVLPVTLEPAEVPAADQGGPDAFMENLD